MGELKDDRAIEPLIACLGDKYYRVQNNAADALVKIGISIVDPLITALGNKNADIRLRAAQILIEMNDIRSTQPFLAALKDGNVAVIAGAYRFIIENGEPGSEDILIKALNTYGDEIMAEDFLNCGNQKLDEAGTKWAKDHKYTITYGGFGNGPEWGISQ